MEPSPASTDLLLTKAEAAARLNVPLRYIERCVAEHRVRVVRLGRHIRIPESALTDMIRAATSPARR